MPAANTSGTMKRVVSSSIVTVVVLIAAAAAFFYISRFSGESGDPVACIPSDAVFYIESAPGSAGVQELLKPDMWNAWKQSPLLGRLYDHLNSARQLMQNEEIRTSWLTEGKLVLSAHVTGASTFDFLILQGFKGSRDEVAEVIGELAGDDFSVSEREYDGNRITEVTLKSGKIFTWALVKGVFAGSFTSFLVEDAVRQQKVGKPAVFKPASSSEESGVTVYLNFSNLPAFLSLYTIEGHPALGALKSFSNWFTGEITASKEGVILDGELSDLDSSRFSHCFSGQKPVAPTLLKIVPVTAAAVLWYGASDMKHFRSRLEKHHAEGNATGMLAKESKRFGVDVSAKLTSWVKDQYALVITEPSSAQFDNNVFAVFKADPVLAEKALTSLASSIDKKMGESTRREEYHGHSIGYLRLLGAVPALYGERFSRLTRMYYTITGDYVVFANQASSLRNYIDEIRSGHLFSGHLKGMLPPTGANFGCFVRPEAAIPVFVSAANSTWKTNIEKYREVVAGTGIFSFVMAVNGNEMHATARLDHVSRPTAPARMLFSVEADTSVTMEPLLATGKNGTRVVFQDDANGLYMADDAGNVIWKFRIDSKIMSRIYPVDYFRNGNMQFLFNTASHIYLIDEKGTPVGNYPIRLPASASNAMVLAPTGNPGENAMYVACENRRVYAYLLSGRPMPDWSFTGTAGIVRSALIPFTLDGKQVLLISDDQGTATVVSASGKPALSLSQGFAPAVYATVFTDTVSTSRELIITSDETGNIVKVSGDGKVEILPVAAAPPGHGFLCTDVDGDGNKDYVFAAGREVTAYDASMAVIFRKELEGDLDGYIYSISEGAISGAVGATSVSSNKTWLLKPDGSVMDGFPVRGSGGFVTGAVGSDGKLHLITGSRSGVNVYTLE